MRRANADEPLPRLATRTDMVDGRRIFARYCQDARQGPPVVLVHGLSMSSRYMAPVARRLARDFPVYAPDLPGYGQSQHPGRPLTIVQMARVLGRWMDALEIGPAVLQGNSMGNQVIAALAEQEPRRLLKAVLVSPSMDPSATRLPKLIFRAAMNMLFEPLSFYPVLLRDYLTAGPRQTLRALDDAIHDPIQERLRGLDVPALVVRGSHDWLVTARWAGQVARLLPRGRLVTIPSAAHAVNYDAPDRLAGIVREFIRA